MYTGRVVIRVLWLLGLLVFALPEQQEEPNVERVGQRLDDLARRLARLGRAEIGEVDRYVGLIRREGEQHGIGRSHFRTTEDV